MDDRDRPKRRSYDKLCVKKIIVTLVHLLVYCVNSFVMSLYFSVSLSVCLSARNNSAPTGRVFIKFDI
jgi:hypothetical protein